MLIFDLQAVGDKLLVIRKKKGLTQAEAAEAAGLSDRTYADIERGSVNMRVETMLRICSALGITPDDILTDESSSIAARQEELWDRLSACSLRERETALALLSIFLRSVG